MANGNCPANCFDLNAEIKLCNDISTCVSCCCNNIDKTLPCNNTTLKITNSWKSVFNLCNEYENDKVNDCRPLLLFLIIGISNLYRETFRALFINYYETQGVNVKSLERGKWLPNNLNFNSKLWQSLLLTQPPLAPIAECNIYIDALKFFMEDNNTIGRHTVAHTFHETFSQASSFKIQDFQNHMIYLLHSLAKISYNIELIRSKKNK